MFLIRDILIQLIYDNSCPSLQFLDYSNELSYSSDMDFNLDGDFDKLSSFKVDMPELDFSCSSKKTAKSKERAEENSSSGNCEGKKDLFSFSFDFNE